MAEMKEKKKVAQIVTERFLEQLKKGVVPWEKPWISINGARVGAWSHSVQSKGKTYSLVNQMMLPGPGEYITYKEIRAEGGHLKKGSHGYPIVFYKNYKTTQRNPKTNVDEEISVPVLRYYTVFSLDDVEGIEQRYQPDTSPLDGLKEPQRCKEADRIVKAYLDRTGVKLKHDAQNLAYYNPDSDIVVLPLKKQFKKKAEYYSTLFHELTHSTGHISRLNRLYTHTAARGKEYSKEELVAEIGAASMLFYLGIETKDSIRNSTAYIDSWIKALDNNPQMIIQASSRADRAVHYMLDDMQVRPHGDKKVVDYTEPPVDKELYPEECPF